MEKLVELFSEGPWEISKNLMTKLSMKRESSPNNIQKSFTIPTKISSTIHKNLETSKKRKQIIREGTLSKEKAPKKVSKQSKNYSPGKKQSELASRDKKSRRNNLFKPVPVQKNKQPSISDFDFN